MNYDVNYFIKKFEAIPEEKMGEMILQRGCALNQCGMTNYGHTTKEAEALMDLFEDSFPHLASKDTRFAVVFRINDGQHDYRQPTPKQRILAALYDIKKAQQPEPEVKERIVYVTVDSPVRELQKKELLLS